MRILLASLVLIGLVVLYGGRYFGLVLPEGVPAPQSTIWVHVFGLFALYLLCEGLFAFISSRGASSRREPAEPHDSLQLLHGELRKLSDENDRLLKRLESSQQERDRLSAELDQQTAKLRSRGGETVRPEQIEAELVAFLSVLQEKARLVDFAMDNITGCSDAQVGAAARVVHAGCREVLNEYFRIRPLLTANEGEAVQVDGQYDPRTYRFLGRVPDHGPYSGVLLHPGWKTEQVTLPRVLMQDGSARDVISPAEVEIK